MPALRFTLVLLLAALVLLVSLDGLRNAWTHVGQARTLAQHAFTASQLGYALAGLLLLAARWRAPWGYRALWLAWTVLLAVASGLALAVWGGTSAAPALGTALGVGALAAATGWLLRPTPQPENQHTPAPQAGEGT